VYVRNKKRACEYCGIKSLEYILDKTASEQQLLDLIDVLNKEPTVHGILVQLPLPPHINEQNIINAISEQKDVDAFHPANVGRLMTGNPDFLPCTPAGVMEMLKKYNIETAGKDCVIIGRSNIVGKPMAMLMLSANSTVTICHSKTKNLKEKCLSADILIAAIGKPKFVTADMVKDGAVVIDVGINRTEDGKLCGDVDFDEVSKKASYITPVPGGVGPMTIATLMKNTLTAFKLRKTNGGK
jgi:methylenetetrahydrofolate dehydrogenase (NADP+)/methenyltetrahydrofolate cyclohydrolase